MNSPCSIVNERPFNTGVSCIECMEYDFMMESAMMMLMSNPKIVLRCACHSHRVREYHQFQSQAW